MIRPCQNITVERWGANPPLKTRPSNTADYPIKIREGKKKVSSKLA